MANPNYFDGPYQGAAAQRKKYEDYNKLTREQKKAVMKRQAAYDKEMNSQYNSARSDAQIGMEGAGVGVYDYMGQNAADTWKRGLMGQMAQQYVMDAARPAPQEEEEEEVEEPAVLPYDWRALYQADQAAGHDSPVNYSYMGLPQVGSFLQQYGMR